MKTRHHRVRGHEPRGFTLIELLVVITIIVLVSAAALPTILPALNHRQVSEAARILQAALAGARDAAIRANEPRGIRLLPDPALTQPAFSATSCRGRRRRPERNRLLTIGSCPFSPHRSTTTGSSRSGRSTT